jgi:CDP-glucose 4,6-dehydratase
MDPEFWRGKSVFLTGHTGFKGSWLALWLQELGAKVTGYSLPPPTTPSLFAAARVAREMESIRGDVRDLEHLQAALSRASPEIVIHMAAQSLVRYSYENPVETYATNVMGTVNVLEAVRQAPDVRAVLVVTSDKCYANREWVWGYRETEAMGGHDPYSSSKGCAELVTAAYRASYFRSGGVAGSHAGVASARAGNVIGGGDWGRDRLVPDIMSAFSAGRPALIRNPGAMRPWQHVLEPLRGYLELLTAMAAGKAGLADGWNFGPRPEDAVPVAMLADRLAKRWAGSVAWESQPLDGPHEAHHLRLDCSKAHMELDWAPFLVLDTVLDWVVEWYRKYTQGADARELSLEQINRYQKLDCR